MWASALEGNRGGPAPGRVREGTRTFSHSTSIYSAATTSWSARTSGSGLDGATGSRPGRAQTHSICAPRPPALPSRREPPSPPTLLQPGLHHRPHPSESAGLLSSCFYRGGTGRAATVAVACSSRNLPPQLPSLTHPGPRGSGDPQVFSSPAPPGLHTSSPGNCSSGSGPAARGSGTASLRSSPSSTGPVRSPTRPRCTSTPLPAPPAALRPRRSHLYAARDIPERETQPRLASLRRRLS